MIWIDLNVVFGTLVSELEQLLVMDDITAGKVLVKSTHIRRIMNTSGAI